MSYGKWFLCGALLGALTVTAYSAPQQLFVWVVAVWGLYWWRRQAR
jgi:hypothetical protein